MRNTSDPSQSNISNVSIFVAGYPRAVLVVALLFLMLASQGTAAAETISIDLSQPAAGHSASTGP